jgi:hypothetical protein
MEKQGRELSGPERVLVAALLVRSGASTSSISTLDQARVLDLQDGGMGSIRFIHSGEARRDTVIAEAQFTDEDGVQVSIELNATTNGRLFELDFWKVDFSPLRRYPRPDDLRELP